MRRYGLTLPWTSSALFLLLVFVSMPAPAATILINDGQSSVVTTGGGTQDVPNNFVVRDLGCGVPDPLAQPCPTAGTPSHVEFGFFTDGAVSGLQVLDSSSMVVDGTGLGWLGGRNIGSVFAGGQSHVDVRSGGFGSIDLSDYATANITGGQGASGQGLTIFLNDNSQADISANAQNLQLRGDSSASFIGFASSILLAERAQLEIIDASIVNLYATGGRITMQSGSISALVLQDTVMSVSRGILSRPPPTANPITLLGASELSLDGAAFKLDGVPINFGVVTANSGVLDVMYSDGLSYSAPFVRTPTSTLILTPEPNTALLMLLGLAGLSWRRRAA